MIQDTGVKKAPDPGLYPTICDSWSLVQHSYRGAEPGDGRALGWAW
jgi:hypothetical protein